MESVKMSTILVMALGLAVWPAQVSEAEPMGTVITYQSRLIDANSAADGLYDFQFKLFDDPNVILGNQVGSDVNKPDVDVIDGYFTVELYFGSAVFNGDARWLEIGVRPGDSNDANDFVTLSPRQEVTPTPYAIYAKTAGGDSDWTVSGDNMYSVPSGNVGIGTTNPSQKLQVDQGDILVNGVGRFTVPGDEAILYMGDTNHSIRSERGFGLKLGTFGAQDAVIIRESTGNVGIGNTADNYKLEVGGTAESTNYARIGSNEWGGILFYDGQGSHSGSIVYHHDDDTMQFQTRSAGGNPTEKMRINSNGNVGIGTINPEYQLDVAGVVNLNKGKTETALRVDGDEALWYDGTYFSWGFGGTANYFADNVGIGTSSPSQRLEIEGASPRILVDATSGNPELNLQAPGKTRWSMYQDATTGDLRFYQAGDKIIFQNGTGNVGIGTADPMGWGAYQGVMHVAGPYRPCYVLEVTKAGYERKWITCAEDGFLKIGEAIAGPSNAFEIGPHGNVGIGGLYYAAYRLAVSGDIAYTGDIYDVSDLRLKENIAPLENAVEKVCSIRGIYFNNKGESQDKREVGVIAQEVETVLPEAVSEDEEGYKWVGYSKLTPLLIEAVKELKAENEKLKQRLEALERKIEPRQFVEVN